MKKPKKLKKPKLPKTVKDPIKKGAGRLKRARKAQTPEEKLGAALSNVPRITNETVGEHREEVLSSARKYIYPLQHSKHHIVRISLGIFIFVIVAFLGLCSLSLYKFQSTGGFIYDVTRIVPFPVAKIGKQWVGYESYLFELRRNMHYYRTQQQANFSTKDGKVQLARLKQQAMDRAVQDAYVKQLAAKYHVSVTGQQVSDQVAMLRSENRLGNSPRVFREVLSEFWGWNENDFRRELKQQLLAQAVATKLNTAANARAASVLYQLQKGKDFKAMAKAVSDDAGTKAAGGQYPSPITLSDHNIPPAITAEAFKLKKGQLSGIINTGYSLDILKVLSVNGRNVNAAHIQINLKPVDTYIKPLADKQPAHKYIDI